MGMIGNVIRVSKHELDLFRQNSELLEKKVHADDSYDQEWYLDLDKSWEAIHYLVNGKSVAETEMEESEPTVLGRVLFNEQLVDEAQDLGYGPAFYLTAIQVSETNSELQKIELSEFDSKYNNSEMNQKGIYPEIWDESESKDFLFDSFNDLRRFYKEAADRNEAIVTFIS